MINIENLNVSELKGLLKKIKNYGNLRKQLGVRGVELFKRELLGKDSLLVEYFGEKDNAVSISIKLFKKMFNLDVKQEDIKYIENKNLKGGMRIFKNNSMVDISFSKIEKLIK